MTAAKMGGIIGFVLHLLIGALLIMAGGFKVAGSMPPEAAEMLAERKMADDIVMIGWGELVTAVLLVLPWTSVVGTLLASSLWGGAIVHHMQADESYALIAGLLAVTWIAAVLRHPWLLQNLWPRTAETPRNG